MQNGERPVPLDRTGWERLWVGIFILGLLVMVALGLSDLWLYEIARYAMRSTFG